MKSEGLLKMIDFAKGTTIYQHIQRNKAYFGAGRKELEAVQLKKTRELFQYANQFVPYYTKLFEQYHIDPEKIDSLNVYQDIPPLTRELIQNHQKELISEKAAFHFKKLFKGSSSGTSGIPIRFVHDPEGESAGKAALYSHWAQFGWGFHLKGLHIWGNTETIKKWNSFSSKISRKMLHRVYADASLINHTEGIIKIVNLIKQYKPDYIECYSMSLYTLSKYLQDNNIRLPNCPFVFTSAENLGQLQRENIEKHIGKVIDFYGCSEINGIACQKPNDQKYYLFGHHVFCETEPTNTEDFNDLIVTDLDNKVMPLIRYKPGDLIDGIFTLEKPEFYPYQYFNKVMGRSTDFIMLENGKKLHPMTIFVGTFLRTFPEIKKHKVVWDNKTLEFHFEVSQVPDKNAIEQTIADRLQAYEVKFSIHYDDKILPGKNGKYKFLEIKTP